MPEKREEPREVYYGLDLERRKRRVSGKHWKGVVKKGWRGSRGEERQ
jgi:hypothetical protein